jgi:hypothetical protein
MGSYCTIFFDEMSICGAKSVVPDSFAALFQESDRDPQPTPPPRGEEEDTYPEYRYSASRQTILRRLSLLGATREAAEKAFEAWLKDQRERWAEHAREGWGQDTAGAAEQLTLEAWRRRVPGVLATLYSPDEADRKPTDVLDRLLREGDLEDSWLWIADYASPLSLRALLDAAEHVQTVTLDMSELVINGYYGSDRPLETEARTNVFITYNPLSPTLILAEGSSDIAVLRASLPVLYPELTDYFSFFNHTELSVDGGAVYLVKFLKAFAAARMTTRMIAVFDNDAAGRQALAQARALALPDNIIVTCLPDCGTAQGYPTIGPQGSHMMDVNGLAAGIEMYLGKPALTDNGQLRPVRWTGYLAGAGAYQGEVECKADVLKAFLARIESIESPTTAHAEFSELAAVWEHLIDLVEGAAEASSLRNWARLQREF